MTAAVLALAALLTGTFPDGGRRLRRFLRFKVPGDHRRDELLFLFLHIPLGPLRGDLNALTAALAIAQDTDLAVVVALLGLRSTVQADLYGFPQQVHGFYIAGAVGGLNEGFLLGHPLLSILIGVLLIFQAAHQPSAGAGDLGGIQAEILGLGHLDGDGQEPVQKLGAAEGPPADAETAHHFGLVPDTDLTQLDPSPEHAGQIPHQLPEVHPAIGGKEENNLTAVKAGRYVHQLHFQTVIRDLLLADVEGLALFFPIVIHGAAVGVSGQPQHGAQGLDNSFVRHLVVPLGAGAEFRALGGLHDDLIAHFHRMPLGVKIIILASAPKADADHFSQRISSNSTAKAPSTWLAPTL